MRLLRQIHLYLGCLFSPLIIYFCLSGTWQLFGFNDVPKDEPASPTRSLLHELSKPHTHSTMPGSNPKLESSTLFKGIAATMGLAMIATALIGIALAWRFTRSPKLVLLCLGLGVSLPTSVLLLR